MSDWKETLFVWRGELELERERERAVWRGGWLGTSDAAGAFPSPSELQSSPNHFELTCTSQQLPLPLQSLPLAVPGGREGACNSTCHEVTWRGHYLLDNGAGLEKHEDFEHHCVFLPIDSSLLATSSSENPKGDSCGQNYFVVARGRTEFGDFVSKGVLSRTTSKDPPKDKSNDSIDREAATDVGGCDNDEVGENERPQGLTLTLARRYLNKGDQRLKGSLADLAKQFMDEAYEANESETENTYDRLLNPWRCLPLRVKRQLPKKQSGKQDKQNAAKKSKV